jgi:hypothetical protein
VDDIVSWEEAVEELGEDMAGRLAAYTDHLDLEGRPCWDRDRFVELLEMLRLGLLR